MNKERKKKLIQVGVVNIDSKPDFLGYVRAKCPKCNYGVLVEHLPMLCKCGVVLIKPDGPQDLLEKTIELPMLEVVNVRDGVTWSSVFAPPEIGNCPRCGQEVIISNLPLICRCKAYLVKSTKDP